MNDPTTDEAYLWPTRSLTSLQDAINEEVKRLAQITAAPALFKERPAPCRLYGMDDYDEINLQAAEDEANAYMRTIGWTSGAMVSLDHDDTDTVGIHRNELWQVPEPTTIVAHDVPLDLLEVMLGIPLIPLCRREIPAEGTE